MKSFTQRVLTAVAIASAISLQLLSLAPAVQAKKEMQSPIPRLTTFQRLRKSDSMWKVLEDEEVKDGMKTVMGSALEKYFDLTQLTEMPEVVGDDLYSAGGVRGLYTECETFFDLNLITKKQCIVLLDGGVLSVYGAASMEQSPQPVKDYIQDVESRYSGTSKLSIRFEKPDTSTREIVKALQPKKNLNLNTITGLYARVDSDQRFECANLKVLRLPGNKIKFCCDALSGSHSGEASGIVPIKGNVAQYDDNFGTDYGYRMTMQFDGKFVYISQKGEGFGGVGVTSTGKYQKMDDKAPLIAAE